MKILAGSMTVNRIFVLGLLAWVSVALTLVIGIFLPARRRTATWRFETAS